MRADLITIGIVTIRNSLGLSGLQRKIYRTSKLAGFSSADISRLSATISETARMYFDGGTGVSIEVFLIGTSEIEGIALLIDRNEKAEIYLNQSHYFEKLVPFEDNGKNTILAVKYIHGARISLSDELITKFQHLLSQLSRDELMDALKVTNKELEDHRANLERTVIERTTELSEKEAQLRLALENMTDGIYVIDKMQNFVLFNKQYLKQVGLPDDVVEVGRNVKEAVRALAIRGDYGDGELSEIVEQRLSGLTSPEYLQSELVINGGERILDLRKASIDGKGAVVISTDITERKEAEKKLTAAHSIITSSIQYASRIQRSILPSKDTINSFCSDHFVIWEPRDIVGGDIYWCEKWGDGMLLILGDCTGHGVPGAFMTLLMTGALERAQMEVAEGEVGKLIQRMHQLAQSVCNQQGSDGESDDGMELGACYLKKGSEEIIFAGARFELFASDGKDVQTLSGTRQGIGYRGIAFDQQYEQKTMKINPEKTYYMTSDGLIDQVGGERRRGYGKNRFRALINSIQRYPLSEQRDQMLEALKEYQGEELRRDDVAAIGFKFYQ